MRLREIRIENDVAYVPLTKGYEAIIDSADLDLVAGQNWHAQVTKRAVYARQARFEAGERKVVLMHRLIMEAPQELFVDHIDCNPMNNRRSNLRLATAKQNSMNRRSPTVTSSGVKGVVWNRKLSKWQAQIRIDGKLRYLGVFSDKIAAADAYDTAALQHFGDFARPNRMEAGSV